MSDLITTIRATVMRGVTAEIDAAVAKTLNAKLAGATSRGVRACAIDDNGHLIFTLTDGSVLDLGKVVGDDGVGISSIAKTGTVGLIDTYTITYTNGTTSSFTVTNGAKGDPGDKGDKGDKGDTGDPGYTPVRGTDYWTAADKAEIVDDTIDNIVFTVTFTETNGVITADKTILEILDAIEAKNRIDFIVAGSNVVYQSFARGGMVGGYGEVSLESIASFVIDGVTPYVLVFAGTSDGETETWTYESKELALREDITALTVHFTMTGDVVTANKTVSEVYAAIVSKRRIEFTTADLTAARQVLAWGESRNGVTKVSFEAIGTNEIGTGEICGNVIVGVNNGSGDTWSVSDNVLAYESELLAYRTAAAQNVIDAGKEDKSNKVTSLSAASTDTQYPSAKCVYDELEDKLDADDTVQATLVPIPTSLANLTDDATHRVVTDTEKAAWNAKGTYSKPASGIPATDLATGVIPTVPTTVSSFTNDAGYLTLATLPKYNGEVS